MKQVIKSFPIVILILWTVLVLNHMSRGLMWYPLVAMYVVLIPWAMMGGFDE
tara:strand:- start:719 stop:874 length:156 start_codon:yes stop_codon:yes gene_type:complete